MARTDPATLSAYRDELAGYELQDIQAACELWKDHFPDKVPSAPQLERYAAEARNQRLYDQSRGRALPPAHSQDRRQRYQAKLESLYGSEREIAAEELAKFDQAEARARAAPRPVTSEAFADRIRRLQGDAGFVALSKIGAARWGWLIEAHRGHSDQWLENRLSELAERA